MTSVLLISVEELITLLENVADSVSIGQCNPDNMALLLSNLRILGPQLEEYSKSTLDQGTCLDNQCVFESVFLTILVPFYSSSQHHFYTYNI